MREGAMNRNSIAGLLAISILIATKWAVVPWFESVHEKRSEIEQLYFTNQKLSQLPQRSEAAQKLLEKAEELNLEIEKRAYVGSNPALISSAILGDLKRIATESNVEIKNQSLGELKPGNINILPVSAYVEGSVDGMATFFKKLEIEASKQYLVDSTTVAKSKRGDGLRANMKLFVMVIKDE